MNFKDFLPYISVICTIIALYVNFNKYSRDREKDKEKQTERHVEIIKTIEMTLDYLKKDVDKISSVVIGVQNKIDEMDRRIVINEQSLKSVHHRLDSMENNCRAEHKNR